jgi:signal transduction histidine kinase
VEGTMNVQADRRALEVIIKNIIQNALIHGQAEKITVSIDKKKSKLTVSGGLKRFEGNLKNLGKLYYRHTQTSRSGIGLYLVKSLSKKMQAEVEYHLDENNFLCTEIRFKKESL